MTATTLPTTTLPTTTETRAFKMFALDYLRLERKQREIVVNELTTYAQKYAAMLKDGTSLGDFESSIMSVNFDRYITNDCYIDDIADVIREFMIRFAD